MLGMPRRCRYCSKPAIVRLRYANLNLCDEHFKQYYENKIRKFLEKYKIHGEILVAVSGGKDSMSLLYALKRLSLTMDVRPYAFHINLGIGEYSRESEKIVREFSRNIEVTLIIYDLKEELGFTIPEIVAKIRRPPCAICGIIKRWVINKVAYESGFEYVATGHNIDDASTYFLKALMTQDIYSILRGQHEFLEPKIDIKLVGRIRPQFYLSERENMLYAQLNNIPIVEISCPYSVRAPIQKYKTAWETLLDINPISQINLTRTLLRLRKMMNLEEPELKACKICGYPTESKDSICAFCKLIKRYKSSFLIKQL